MTKCSRSNQRELHKFVPAIYPRAPSTQFQRRPLDGSTRLPRTQSGCDDDNHAYEDHDVDDDDDDYDEVS